MEITTALLSGADPDRALLDLVRHARSSAPAVGAGVFVPANADSLRLTVVEGAYEPWLGSRVPVDGSIAGAALAADTAILVADAATDTRTNFNQAEPSGSIGPTLAVPIPGSEGPAGVLAVSRSPAAEPFDDRDQHMIAAFASRAGLALTLATSRRQSEELHLIEDRGYIAEQLREGVISRLFAAGLAVQAVLPRVGNTSAKESLNRHIDEIDGIISDIRKAVFSLREPPANGP